MPSPTTFPLSTRVCLTASVPAEYALEITAAAERLKVSRHKLLVLALQIGIPRVTALIELEAAAVAAQQQTAVKE